MMGRLRNLFISGLVVLIPVVATVYVLVWVVGFSDRLLGRYVYERLGFTIPGLGLVIIVAIILGAGLLARNLIGRRLLLFAEAILTRTPLVRTVYVTVKQMVDMIANQNQSAFKHVVLVEYPRKGVYSLGFVTGEVEEVFDRDMNPSRMVKVLITTTPNPTTGFLVVVPEEELIYLRMGIEDAFKVVISAGVIEPGPFAWRPRRMELPGKGRASG